MNKKISSPAMTVRSQDPSSRSIHVRPGICTPQRVGRSREESLPREHMSRHLRPARCLSPSALSGTAASRSHSSVKWPSLSGAARLDTRQVFNVFGWLVGRIVVVNGVIEPHQKLVKY